MSDLRERIIELAGQAVNYDCGETHHKVMGRLRDSILEDIERLEKPVLPKEPNPSLIESMCYRYDHGHGLQSEVRQEANRKIMRQLYEEVAGYGFWSPDWVDPMIRIRGKV